MKRAWVPGSEIHYGWTIGIDQNITSLFQLGHLFTQTYCDKDREVYYAQAEIFLYFYFKLRLRVLVIISI